MAMNNNNMDGSYGNSVISPANIIIIGGGRWARILTEVICTIVDTSVNISIYSKGNASYMAEWVSLRIPERNIQVFSALPHKFLSPSNAVIVANAARDHEKAAAFALSAGGNVMVEKPLTLSHQASERLIALAHKSGKTLVTAHIFLFARYFQNYSSIVSKAGEITSIRCNWVDPKSENRYGETKRYDTSLPIFVDWLPHILPMIRTFASGKSQSCINLELNRGGALVEIQIMVGEIPCYITLERNGATRKRFMEVTVSGKMMKLDFSTEPGVIQIGSEKINGDPEWQTNERPSVSMIKAFLRGAAGKGYDERLDVEIGLSSSKVIDQAMVMYRIKHMEWLVERLAAKIESDDEDLHYALKEIFQVDNFISNSEIEQKIESLTKVFSEDSDYWLNELRKKNAHRVILQMGSI